VGARLYYGQAQGPAPTKKFSLILKKTLVFSQIEKLSQKKKNKITIFISSLPRILKAGFLASILHFKMP